MVSPGLNEVRISSRYLVYGIDGLRRYISTLTAYRNYNRLVRVLPIKRPKFGIIEQPLGIRF